MELLNSGNCVGAVVTLKRSRTMPCNVPVLVLEYSHKDAGSKYRNMILVEDKDGNTSWVYVSCVKEVLKYGRQAMPESVSRNNIKAVSLLNK